MTKKWKTILFAEGVRVELVEGAELVAKPRRSPAEDAICEGAAWWWTQDGLTLDQVQGSGQVQDPKIEVIFY